MERSQPIYLPLYDAPSKTIYLVDEGAGLQSCAHFPLMGRRLQHSVETGSAKGLVDRRCDYVAWMRGQQGEEALSLRHYRIKVDAAAGVLYEPAR